jgi:NTP pyrophosphatase (non-canonical NTP hydrolase)
MQSHLKLYATVSGSFNQFWNQIQKTILEFQQSGVTVLSPGTSRRTRSRKGFLFLERDEGGPREIETRHLQSIARSDFLYVVNPGGYIGTSAAMEIGYALRAEIPVFLSSPPSDYVIRSLARNEKSVSKIKRIVESLPRKTSKNGLTLRDIQDEVKYLSRKKGFRSESIRDKILLLTEELGELARVSRSLTGMKIRKRHQTGPEYLSNELADFLIYLADIANSSSCDLETAFRHKIRANMQTTWVHSTRPSRLARRL